MEDSQTFHCTLSLYYQNVLRELQKSQTTLHLGVYSVKPPKEFFNVKKIILKVLVSSFISKQMTNRIS